MTILAQLISNYSLNSKEFRLNNIKDNSSRILINYHITSKNYTPENNQSNQRVSQAIDPFNSDLNLNQDLKESYDFLEEPRGGYSLIKRDVLALVEAGYSDLDILMAMAESYDRLLVERVLDDLCKKGLF